MRTALARANDLYKLVKGEIKYDHIKKTITHPRMYRRDGSYFDPDPYVINDDEIATMIQCMDLAGGDDYSSPVTTLNDAMAQKLPVYISPDPCKNGHFGLKLLSGKCYFCQAPDSPRKRAIKAGEQWYMPETACPDCHKVALKRVNNGQCSGCIPRQQDRSNSPRQQAIRSGLKWYMPTEQCPHCHQIALKRVQDGLCSGCRPRRADRATSPRQEAIRAGHKWFIPSDPCPTCGHIAPKRVQDSMCSGCTDSKSLQWILSNLDMIVSRDMAAVFDIDVYHEDGEPWKWFKTGKDVTY